MMRSGGHVAHQVKIVLLLSSLVSLALASSLEGEESRWNEGGARDLKRNEEHHSHDGDVIKKWNKNGMRMWGKRTSLEDNEDDDEGGTLDKKWNKNGMRMWGKKRNEDEAEDAVGSQGGLDKKWNKNGMRMWGKRSEEEKEKKWNQNGIRMWGKRGEMDTKSETRREEKDKEEGLRGAGAEKKWNKNMRMWGKRDEGFSPETENTEKNKNHVGGKINKGTKVSQLEDKVRKDDDDEDDDEKRAGSKSKLRTWNKRSAATSVEDKKNVLSSKNVMGDSKMLSEDGRSHSRHRTSYSAKNKPVQSHASSSTTSLNQSNSSASNLLNQSESSTDSSNEGKVVSRKRRSWGQRQNLGGPWYLVKRAASSRAHYYPEEGPKRSWRTNVIRVWGKRGGE